MAESNGAKTTTQRLNDLDEFVRTLKIWAKVLGPIAVALSLTASGVFLFLSNRYDDLKVKADKTEEVVTRNGGIEQRVREALEAQVPAAIANEIKAPVKVCRSTHPGNGSTHDGYQDTFSVSRGWTKAECRDFAFKEQSGNAYSLGCLTQKSVIFADSLAVSSRGEATHPEPNCGW